MGACRVASQHELALQGLKAARSVPRLPPEVRILWPRPSSVDMRHCGGKSDGTAVHGMNVWVEKLGKFTRQGARLAALYAACTAGCDQQEEGRLDRGQCSCVNTGRTIENCEDEGMIKDLQL